MFQIIHHHLDCILWCYGFREYFSLIKIDKHKENIIE